MRNFGCLAQGSPHQTDADLDKIRLIIKEEIDPVKKDVAVMQDKLEGIDKRFDGVNKRIDDLQNHVDKRINIVTYIVCALVALIAIAIIPQYIFYSAVTKRQSKIAK